MFQPRHAAFAIAFLLTMAACGNDRDAPASAGEEGSVIVVELAELAAGNDLGDVVDAVLDRLGHLGVPDGTEVTVSGEAQLEIRLPAGADVDTVAAALAIPGDLSFRPVLEMSPLTADVELAASLAATDQGWVADQSNSSAYLVGPAAISAGSVAEALPMYQAGGPGGWVVTLQFTPDAAVEFADLTGALAKYPFDDVRRMLAIILDGVVIAAPQISPDVDPSVGITGGTALISLGSMVDSAAEAEALAAAFVSAQPLPVTRVSVELSG